MVCTIGDVWWTAGYTKLEMDKENQIGNKFENHRLINEMKFSEEVQELKNLLYFQQMKHFTEK